jgi:predicted ATPase
MEGKTLLRTLRLTNLLSYGPEGTEVELQPLNVLIGPNGSGKSNLIDAISLLKAAPTDISAPIRAGGGMPEWVWKGSATPLALDFEIQTTISYLPRRAPIQYQFRLKRLAQNLELAAEHIEYIDRIEEDQKTCSFIYTYAESKPLVCIDVAEFEIAGTVDRAERLHEFKEVNPRESILSQRKDPEVFPQFAYLAGAFHDIHLFRNPNFGHDSPVRGPQRADEPGDFLLEDGKNLGVVLNDLLNRPPTKKRLVAELKRFYEPVEDITTKVVAGTVETFFHEHGLRDSMPSVRLSDGTLRYLCLLTILCHPEPPPLVCIEDPEIGLHPDILPIVAELLIEASQRTQLIVTTHSDILVSALSHVPEAVIVCERDDAGTHLRRLEPDRLKEWLEKYTLGELWRMGETGGNP